MGTELSFHKRQSCKSAKRLMINDHFTSISKEPQKYKPPTKKNFSDNLKNPNPESLFMTSTTPEEISDFIKTISSNKSAGMRFLFLSQQSLTIPLKTGPFQTY